MKNETYLQREVKFWGGVDFGKISQTLGFTQTYIYMVLTGKRRNAAISSEIMMCLNRRKKELKQRLLNEPTNLKERYEQEEYQPV